MSLVASIVSVSSLERFPEVMYFPETVSLKSKTAFRFDVPPVSVAFSIVNLCVSVSHEEAIPTFCKAVINPSIVVSFVTLIVLFSPLTLKTAFPFALKPKLPSFVVSSALIVFVTEYVRALDLE